MATAEELLSTSYEPHFYISEDLRTISIPFGQSVIGVYSDENVRRIWFDMPSTCDGTDLSDFEITINYRNALGDVGRYYVTDAIVDNSTITFSWLVSRSVCVSEGFVLFNVCLRLFDTDNETILKEFNTTLAEMRVLRGLEANLEITTPQQDAINSVVGPAVEAATAANEAKVRANEAAAEASSAAESVTDALSLLDSTTERAEAAIEAIGDISELTVPLMSSTTRGGATIGNGLTVDGGALSIGDIVTDETNGPIYSVDAKGWAEQDGTPTPDNPQEVRVARGRNLWDEEWELGSFDTTTGANITNNKQIRAKNKIAVMPGATYFVNSPSYVWMIFYDGNNQVITEKPTGNYASSGNSIGVGGGGYAESVTMPASCRSVRFYCQNIYGTTYNNDICINVSDPGFDGQYIPYGHVGLEVRDSSDELVSVTPIPLPSKGFAASLPDGTADVLKIDSAGGYEWDAPVGAVDMGTLNWYKRNPTDDGTATVYRIAFNAAPMNTRNIQCDSFQCIAPLNPWERISLNQIMISGGFLVAGGSSDYASGAEFKAAVSGVMLYYPLITTTTEHGYIDLPNIPDGATITCPELREVGVRCFVPGVSELIDHANNWGARCKQNESRIAALEAAIANLATSEEGTNND